VPDLSKFDYRKDRLQVCKKVYPDAKKMGLARSAGQLWDFSKRIMIGDLVALPIIMQPLIAIGQSYW
jgi:predicted Mrr-cat superfamily restriction endonuclease